jgi:type IV pilus assembly protein PilY1
MIHDGAAVMKTAILKTTTTGLMIFLLGLAFSARADDTDVYLNPEVPTGAEPLVMFTLDYRPNLGSTQCTGVSNTSASIQTACGYSEDHADVLVSLNAGADGKITFFENLRAALKRVLDPLDGLKIGFILPHNHQSNCAGQRPASPNSSQRCSNGAYIPYGFKSINASDSNSNKANFYTMLSNIPEPQGNQSHAWQLREMYFEFFRYLTGQSIYNAHNGYTDFATDNTLNVGDVGDKGPKWDSTIENPADSNSATYISPLTSATECTKIFMINFGFGTTTQDADSDTAIQATKASGGMAITLSGGDNNKTLQVIDFMNDADLSNGTFGSAGNIDGAQNVVSYFLVDSVSLTDNQRAAAGGTGNAIDIGDDPEALVETLNNIFKSILSVSTTFVAPSVPVNVFNRAQTLNEVYLALFEAEESGLPRWPGNLKKLIIGENAITGDLELQDVNGINAIDIDGRIKQQALTFWTDATTLPDPVDDEVDGADGRSVERGGVGQKIPGYVTGSPGLSNSDAGARQLFTEDPSDTTDGLLPLNANATTAAALWSEITAEWDPAPSSSTYAGATTAEQNKAINILRFARGLSGDTTTDSTTKLTWFLGDPLHSRPLPINYGARGSYTSDNPDIRIAMGTNYGFMHFFTNTTTAAAQSGAETWGYIPRDVIPKLDRLRNNVADTPKHPILTDGSPSVLLTDADLDGTVESGDEVHIFFGLRRGGKSYYALDVTDPAAPKYLWTITKGDTGFEELGQTWSKPVVGKLRKKVIDSTASISATIDVVVFGGGYNGDDDGDNVIDAGESDLGKDQANRDFNNDVTPIDGGSDDIEGNAIYIVNAEDGSLIWKAIEGTAGFDSTNKALKHPDLNDSIPMELAVIDTDGDGLLDRIYFGDTGGRVWRADIPFVDTDSDGNIIEHWTLTMMLDAGRHAGEPDRRFFNRPDVVQTEDEDGSFDAILIGSGDRENPLSTHVTDDTFFMIKDRSTTSGSPPVEDDPATTGVDEGAPLSRADLADLTEDCVSDNTCPAETVTALANGWFIDLATATGDDGEKNLAAAITLGGVVFFSTFAPGSTSSSCDLSEGTGKTFAVNLQDATPVFNYNTANDGDGTTYERFDTLESGGIPVEAVPLGDDIVLIQGQAGGQNIQETGTITSWKTYWYETNP